MERPPTDSAATDPQVYMVDRLVDVLLGADPLPLREGEGTALVAARKEGLCSPWYGYHPKTEWLLRVSDLDWVLAVLAHQDLDKDHLAVLGMRLEQKDLRQLTVTKAMLSHPAADDDFGVRYFVCVWTRSTHRNEMVVEWVSRNGRPVTRMLALLAQKVGTYDDLREPNVWLRRVATQVGRLGPAAVETYETLLKERLSDADHHLSDAEAQGLMEHCAEIVEALDV